MTTLSDIAERLVQIHRKVSEDKNITWKDYYFTERLLRMRVEYLDQELEKLGIECKHSPLSPMNKSWQYIGNGD